MLEEVETLEKIDQISKLIEENEKLKVHLSERSSASSTGTGTYATSIDPDAPQLQMVTLDPRMFRRGTTTTTAERATSQSTGPAARKRPHPPVPTSSSSSSVSVSGSGSRPSCAPTIKSATASSSGKFPRSDAPEHRRFDFLNLMLSYTVLESVQTLLPFTSLVLYLRLTDSFYSHSQWSSEYAHFSEARCGRGPDPHAHHASSSAFGGHTGTCHLARRSITCATGTPCSSFAVAERFAVAVVR